MTSSKRIIELLDTSGFAIISDVLSAPEVENLIAALGRVGTQPYPAATRPAHAIRNLLVAMPEVRALAGSPKIHGLVESILGADGVAVRGILFDKIPQANWMGLIDLTPLLFCYG